MAEVGGEGAGLGRPGSQCRRGQRCACDQDPEPRREAALPVLQRARVAAGSEAHVRQSPSSCRGQQYLTDSGPGALPPCGGRVPAASWGGQKPPHPGRGCREVRPPPEGPALLSTLSRVPFSLPLRKELLRGNRHDNLERGHGAASRARGRRPTCEMKVSQREGRQPGCPHSAGSSETSRPGGLGRAGKPHRRKAGPGLRQAGCAGPGSCVRLSLPAALPPTGWWSHRARPLR